MIIGKMDVDEEIRYSIAILEGRINGFIFSEIKNSFNQKTALAMSVSDPLTALKARSIEIELRGSDNRLLDVNRATI